KVTLFSEKHIKIFFKKFLTYHQNAFSVCFSVSVKPYAAAYSGIVWTEYKKIIKTREESCWEL
uniref:hypothetical protein n=1 Tax=Clostridium sp. M62/1 TaxID=411486 RepID=UPI00356780CA